MCYFPGNLCSFIVSDFGLVKCSFIMSMICSGPPPPLFVWKMGRLVCQGLLGIHTWKFKFWANRRSGMKSSPIFLPLLTPLCHALLHFHAQSVFVFITVEKVKVHPTLSGSIYYRRGTGCYFSLLHIKLKVFGAINFSFLAAFNESVRRPQWLFNKKHLYSARGWKSTSFLRLIRLNAAVWTGYTIN